MSQTQEIEMIEIQEVTKRFVLQKGACLQKGTRMTLFAKAVLPLHAHCDQDWVVELFLQLAMPDPENEYRLHTVQLDFDKVFDPDELPDPSGNKQRWERVRLLVRDKKGTPNEAWAAVAVASALRKATFVVDLDQDNETFSFCIERYGREALEATGDRDILRPFITYTDWLDEVNSMEFA